MGNEPRIGVYVCHCGSNIAGTVDIEEVTEFARSLDMVVVAATMFSCVLTQGRKLSGMILGISVLIG